VKGVNGLRDGRMACEDAAEIYMVCARIARYGSMAWSTWWLHSAGWCKAGGAGWGWWVQCGWLPDRDFVAIRPLFL